MVDLKVYLSDFVSKNQINREFFLQNNIPTNFDQITVFLCFGNLRSVCATSTLVLPRVRKELKSTRYFIVVGQPNQKDLFPYADEYWSFKNENLNKMLNDKSVNNDNTSNEYVSVKRTFHEHFREVLDQRSYKDLYDFTFTENYWRKNKNVRVILPRVFSNSNFTEYPDKKLYELPERKVFIYPNKFVGDVEIPQEFWNYIIFNLTSQDVGVVCFYDDYAYDLSASNLDNKKVLFKKSNDLMVKMSWMKRTGFVLDFYSGISRLAAISKTSFLLIDDRKRYVLEKESEFEDVVFIKGNFSKRFFVLRDLFSSPSLMLILANNIVGCVEGIDYGKLAIESEYVDRIDDYKNIRYNRVTKMGIKYIKRHKGLRLHNKNS